MPDDRVSWASLKLDPPTAWKDAGSEENVARMNEFLSELPVIELEEVIAMTEGFHEPDDEQVTLDYNTEEERVAAAVQKIVEDVEADRVPDASVKLTSHTIHYESPAGNVSPLPAAICSCGKSKYHAQFKKVHQWAEKHSEETGHIMLGKS